MFDELIEYADIIDITEEVFAFGNVTFKKDFGPFKTGEQFDQVAFNVEDCTLCAYEEMEEGDSNTPRKQCKFMLQPTE